MEEQLASKTPGTGMKNCDIKFAMAPANTGTGARKGLRSFPRKYTQPSALETQRSWTGSYLLTLSVA